MESYAGTYKDERVGVLALRTIPAQQGYDPAHSGVRQAHNQPGKRVESPGRETGIAWGEDQQMGHTTDTPDRKNPAE